MATAAMVLSTDTPAVWLALGADSAPGTGWESDLGFDDSTWIPASPGPVAVTVDGLLGTIWRNPAQSGQGWFRHEFTLSGPLINPDLDAFFDDDGELYLNGALVWDDKNGFATNALVDFDIGAYLNVGANLIAFHAYDVQGGFRYGGVRLEADGIVPEPSSILLLSLGFAGLLSVRRVAPSRFLCQSYGDKTP
jgi:hypothetical protein